MFIFIFIQSRLFIFIGHGFPREINPNCNCRWTQDTIQTPHLYGMRVLTFNTQMIATSSQVVIMCMCVHDHALIVMEFNERALVDQH